MWHVDTCKEGLEEVTRFSAKEALCGGCTVTALTEEVVDGCQTQALPRGQPTQPMVTQGELAVSALHAGAGALKYARQAIGLGD